jgi:hypothetical protein
MGAIACGSKDDGGTDRQEVYEQDHTHTHTHTHTYLVTGQTAVEPTLDQEHTNYWIFSIVDSVPMPHTSSNEDDE